MRTFIAILFLLAGCSRVPEEISAGAGAAQKPAGRPAVQRAIECAGSEGTRYFRLNEKAYELTEWSEDLGQFAPVCRDWGDACGVEIFPRKVTVFAAKSSQEQLKISLDRITGIIVVEESHFDDRKVFVGGCKPNRPINTTTRRRVL